MLRELIKILLWFLFNLIFFLFWNFFFCYLKLKFLIYVCGLFFWIIYGLSLTPCNHCTVRVHIYTFIHVQCVWKKKKNMSWTKEQKGKWGNKFIYIKKKERCNNDDLCLQSREHDLLVINQMSSFIFSWNLYSFDKSFSIFILHISIKIRNKKKIYIKSSITLTLIFYQQKNFFLILYHR